jgi:uncharacterized protein (DUF2225 family)
LIPEGQPDPTRMVADIFLKRVNYSEWKEMNEHIIEYHYLQILRYESIGNIHAAKYHLKMIWEERRHNG